MRVRCPSCDSEAVDCSDFEGGAGETYIEHWTCLDCNDYWDEYYIHENEIEDD